MGCGPMTAGLALVDWYQSKEYKPLGLTYIGVDDAEHCRNFAESFANRHELFAMQNPPIFRADCSEFDVNELKNYVTQNGTLLFIFSYVFGQDSCKQEHIEKWALFVRQVMTTCNAKHNLVAYINSPPYPDRENPGKYIDPNAKYAQLCQLLGWRDQELNYRTGTDYKYPQSFLNGFNEPNDIIAAKPSQQSFRHVLVDARLVDKRGIPIREDRKLR